MTVLILAAIGGLIVLVVYGFVAYDEARRERTATPEAWEAGRRLIHRPTRPRRVDTWNA